MMFDIDHLTFIDFESASEHRDLKADGSIRYADDASTRAIVLAYAIGNGPAQSWHADGAILDWNNAPEDLQAAWRDGTTFMAWNASFDSAIWNYATLNFPFLEVEDVIDAMIQAGISNLPTDLESASRALGGTGKQKDGKKLIKLFCVKCAAPAEHPEEWQRFLSYARQDIDAMRDVYRRTRPLAIDEWRQYWAFEHVNRRGVTLDMPFVLQASKLAAEDVTASNRRLTELTGGIVTTVNQAQRLATWLHDHLPNATMRDVLIVSADNEDDEADDAGDDEDDPSTSVQEAASGKLCLRRDRVEKLLAMLDIKHANGGLTAAEIKAREAATLRLYGAGAAPKKFARLAAQQVNGVLRDQYRFAGAGQTGRMSSKAAQIQNLTRDVLGPDGAAEAPLVDTIADGCGYAALVAADPIDVPPARKLALLVRPALIAGPGKVFVWSDWSAIEARTTPWLANSEGAEKVLAVYSAYDAEVAIHDNYTLAAADVLHKPPGEITRADRQIGKVVVLACGFGGGIGALKRMALAYRIELDDDAARKIVEAWRDANLWACRFWGALWDAALLAWGTPGQLTTAGRLAFVYDEQYLGGTLFMALPSGRWLTYPRPRWRDVEVLDKKGQPTGKMRRELSFRRARGRAKLWHGTLCENAVQGTAADVLRATVTRIERNPRLAFMPIRLHTHDEIVCETDEARVAAAKYRLREEMLTLPAWAEGLPLASEESVCAWYTKSKSNLKA